MTELFADEKTLIAELHGVRFELIHSELPGHWRPRGGNLCVFSEEPYTAEFMGFTLPAFGGRPIFSFEAAPETLVSYSDDDAVFERIERLAGQPDVVLAPGDVVEIASLRDLPLKPRDEFDHPDDASMKEIELQVRRANGDIEPVPGKLRFVGPSAPDLLCSKVDLINWRYGSELEPEFQKLSESYATALRALTDKESEIFKDLINSLEASLVFFKSRISAQEFIVGFLLSGLVDAAIELGQASAVLDAERWKPDARRGRATAAGGRQGGRRSGEARRAKIEADWGQHTLELVRIIRASDQEISRAKAAREITARWKRQGQIPTERWVEKRLRSAVDRGEIRPFGKLKAAAEPPSDL